MKKFLWLIVVLLLTACATTPVDPKKQPDFPEFPEPGQHWVIDKGCNFDPDTVAWADQTLEQLRLDGIAEVAVLCVKDVKDNSATDDGLIWLRDWMREVKLGDPEDDRSIAFLIRPDMDPTKGNRIIAELSRHLYVSVVDYGPVVENAADWANQNQFSGTLESIVRDIDTVLREYWKYHSTP